MYILKYRLAPVGIVSKEFNSIKSMSQFIRRHKIGAHHIFLGDDQQIWFGSKLFSLKAAALKVQGLQKLNL